MKRVWKKSYLGALALITALSLSACASTERQVLESTEEGMEELLKWKEKMPKDMPEKMELKLNENVEIDAFLDISDELSEWKTEELTLTRHLLDETKCEDDLLELLGNPEVENREWVEREDTLEDGTTLKMDTADLKNGGFVQARNLYFLMVCPDDLKKAWDLGSDFIMKQSGVYDKAELNKELAFGGWEEVCGKVEDFLEKENIKDIQKPTIYSFTPELLQQVADNNYQEYVSRGWEESEYAQKYNLTFEEEDGEYLIRYTQGYNGIPYAYLQLVDREVDGAAIIRGTEMSIIYSKDGIIDIDGQCFFNMVQAGEKKEILSLYDILKRFQDRHKSESNKISMKQIGLNYLPILSDAGKLEFHGVPVWYIVYDETKENGTERKHVTYNAVTGEMYQ